MKQALVVLADGFEELEAVTVIDVLRRGGVAVTVAGLGAGPRRGSHDIVLGVDAELDAVEVEGFDALVLPGGMPGARHLRESERVRSLVRRFSRQGKLVAAICAGPTVLEASGILAGRKATSYPGFELSSADYRTDDVVEDGQIVTSRGPATALEFALRLTARLVGPEQAEEVARRMLVAPA